MSDSDSEIVSGSQSPQGEPTGPTERLSKSGSTPSDTVGDSGYAASETLLRQDPSFVGVLGRIAEGAVRTNDVRPRGSDECRRDDRSRHVVSFSGTDHPEERERVAYQASNVGVPRSRGADEGLTLWDSRSAPYDRNNEGRVDRLRTALAVKMGVTEASLRDAAERVAQAE